MYEGANASLSRFYNLFVQIFDSHAYLAGDSLTEASFRTSFDLLAKRTAELKAALNTITNPEQRDYYSRLSDAAYKSLFLEFVVAEAQMSGKHPEDNPTRPLRDMLQSPSEKGLTIRTSLALNDNKVTRVDHEPSSGFDALTALHKGHPINSLYSFKYAGFVDGNYALGTTPMGELSRRISLAPSSRRKTLFSVEDSIRNTREAFILPTTRILTGPH